MKAEVVWNELLNISLKKGINLKTKTGLNFILVSNGKHLTVVGSELTPSSKLQMPRSIHKDNFLKVFPYYERWKSGEKGLSNEITKLTVNSVYIMAAIKAVCE